VLRASIVASSSKNRSSAARRQRARDALAALVGHRNLAVEDEVAPRSARPMNAIPNFSVTS
jgi:hypothetical protein